MTQEAEILQFGTSRFLLAHVDYFVSQSLAAGYSHKRVVIVQGSSRPAGKQKARDLAARLRYPVRFRGQRDGQSVDREETVDSLVACLIADEDWAQIEKRFCEDITHVVSNTGEDGYAVPADDSPLHPLPASFPTRLTRLLNARFHHSGAGVTLMPCELIQANGQRLNAIVHQQAQRAYNDPEFSAWLDRECLWVDTLVDRIVSATIEPVGAVAEPYGLWAVRDTPGLELPCRHSDAQVVDDLTPFEQRKLHILNLSHTWLVHHWRASGLTTTLRFVREAMNEPVLRQPLETILREEILPVLKHQMPGMALDHYLTTTFERFDNPFLDHRLEDIAQHHGEKLRRRLLPVYEMGRTQGYPTSRLERVLKAEGVI